MILYDGGLALPLVMLKQNQKLGVVKMGKAKRVARAAIAATRAVTATRAAIATRAAKATNTAVTGLPKVFTALSLMKSVTIIGTMGDKTMKGEREGHVGCNGWRHCSLSVFLSTLVTSVQCTFL
jgi:hypothetical protein